MYNARVARDRQLPGAVHGGERGALTKTHGVLLAILLLAFALRFYGLGAKGLWGDEIAQAVWSAWDWARLWEEFRKPPDFILHFALIHLTLGVGTGEFWVRLASAVTSFLCVPLTYVISRRLAGRATAAVAMLFVAVAPYQVWYAQEARMYAGLACWALAALYFLLRVTQSGQTTPRSSGQARDRRRLTGDGRRMTLGGWGANGLCAVGLTVGNALVLYTHLFGMLVVLSEVVIGAGILLAGWAKERRVRLPGWAVWLGASWAATGILALPLAAGTLAYVTQGGVPAVPETIAPTPPFHFTWDFALGLIREFGLGAGEFWRTGLTLAAAVIGWVMLVRGNPRAGWVTGVWIAFPLVVLAVTQPKHGVAARYLIYLQPVYLMLAAHGAVESARTVGHWLHKGMNLLGGVNADGKGWGVGYALAGLVILAGIVAPPFDALYRRAKHNDWRAVAAYIESHAEPGDLALGERNTPNMNALAYYLPNLLRYSTPPTTWEAMQNAVQENRRMWYVSVGEYFDKEGDGWARANLKAIPFEAWRAADWVYEPTDAFSFPQSEALAEIFFNAGELPGEIEYAGKQGFANEGTTQVRLNPGDVLEAKLELKGGRARFLEITFTSKKPAQFDVSANGEKLAQVRETETDRGERAMRWELGEGGDTVLVRVMNASAEYPMFVRRISLERE